MAGIDPRQRDLRRSRRHQLAGNGLHQRGQPRQASARPAALVLGDAGGTGDQGRLRAHRRGALPAPGRCPPTGWALPRSPRRHGYRASGGRRGRAAAAPAPGHGTGAPHRLLPRFPRQHIAGHGRPLNGHDRLSQLSPCGHDGDPASGRRRFWNASSLAARLPRPCASRHSSSRSPGNALSSIRRRPCFASSLPW